MPLIRRKWTAEDAEEWTREDWLAALLASLAYVFLSLGLALSLLLDWTGYVIFLLGVVCSVLMYYVVDPKLKKLSEEYEAKEREYIKEIEKAQRWEE